MQKNFFIAVFFLSSLILSGGSFLYAEDVNLSTYYPSPYGSYKQLQVQEDSRSLKTDFTQAVTRAGINIITTYTANNFTPGVFWSTSGALNNPDRPKAGIWMQETAAGSLLYLGTSNNYATGITNDGIVLDQGGNVAISGLLTVASPALTASNDQGGAMELGGNATTANPELGGRPYIDFHYGRGVAEDFNARVINQDDGFLNIVTRVGGAAAATRLSIGENVGVGTATPQTTSPSNGVANGNLTANDIYLSSTSQWVSQIAGGGGGGTTSLITKASNQIVSGTTFANDSTLKFNVGANETWDFDLNIIALTGNNTIKFRFNGPALGTGWIWAQIGGMLYEPISGGVFTNGVMSNYTASGGYWPTNGIVIRGTIKTGATAGTLTLQWAKSIGSDPSVAVASGSTLKFRKV